jgi:hypothetical protein
VFMIKRKRKELVVSGQWSVASEGIKNLSNLTGSEPIYEPSRSTINYSLTTIHYSLTTNH